jgi:hypothetical protein
MTANKLMTLLVISAALAGCVTTGTAPVVYTVEVPIAEKCDAPVPQRPAFAVDALPIGASIDEQMRSLRAERLQRKGYEIELEAAVQACR